MYDMLQGSAHELPHWPMLTLFLHGLQNTVPQQNNAIDCGVFTAMFIRHIALGARPLYSGFSFSQADVPAIRRHILQELLGGEILPSQWD